MGDTCIANIIVVDKRLEEYRRITSNNVRGMKKLLVNFMLILKVGYFTKKGIQSAFGSLTLKKKLLKFPITSIGGKFSCFGPSGIKYLISLGGCLWRRKMFFYV